MKNAVRILKAALLCLVTATAQASFVSSADIRGDFLISGFDVGNPNEFTVQFSNLTNFAGDSGSAATAVLDLPPTGTYDVTASGTVDFINGNTAGVMQLALLISGGTSTTFPISGALSFASIFINPAAWGISVPGIYTYDSNAGTIVLPDGTTTTSGSLNIPIPGGIPNPPATFTLAPGMVTLNINEVDPSVFPGCTATTYCGLGAAFAAIDGPPLGTINGSFGLQGTATFVPEPATWSLFALGLIGLRRLKRKHLLHAPV